ASRSCVRRRPRPSGTGHRAAPVGSARQHLLCVLTMKDERPKGILDGQEDTTHVALEGRASPSIEMQRGARRRLLAGAFTLVALLGGTYLVPGLEWIRPWQAGEGYVPFWNVIGREL